MLRVHVLFYSLLYLEMLFQCSEMLPAISSGNLASIFALSVPHHSREKRQGRQNQFRNNYDQDDDDWYVFDVVEEAPNEKKNQERFSPNNNVQFGTQPPRPRPSRPPAPTTPFIPAFPNAGPPKLPRCEEDCNRQTATSQYNPVCGTNSVTYVNLGRLNCAALCGTDVSLRLTGRCAPFFPPR